MSKISQGEAVFQAVSSVFDTSEAVPETGSWSDKQKEAVYGSVFTMFKTGVTSHSKNPDDAALLKYIPGLVNNWVRKDPRLNGGGKYVTKKPGSRTGSGDEMVKNMRLLLATVTDADEKRQIQEAIDDRLSSLKPKVTINAAAIPENLRHLIKQ